VRKLIKTYKGNDTKLNCRCSPSLNFSRFICLHLPSGVKSLEISPQIITKNIKAYSNILLTQKGVHSIHEIIVI